MAPTAIRFELPDQGYDDKYILPPTHVSLKRKPSTASTHCSSTAYSASYSTSSQDDDSCHSSITSRPSIGYMERSNDNNNNHTRRIEEERPYVEFITNYNKEEDKNDGWKRFLNPSVKSARYNMTILSADHNNFYFFSPKRVGSDLSKSINDVRNRTESSRTLIPDLK